MKNIPDFYFKHKSDNSPILSKNDIDNHASEFLKEYSKSNQNYSVYIPQKTPIEDIIEIYCEIAMDFKTFVEPLVLGMTAFSSGFIDVIDEGKQIPYQIEKGTILISSELAENENQKGRYFYTLAHELGHIVYHRNYYEIPDDSFQLSLFDDEPKNKHIVVCHRDSIENLDFYNKNWIEWQADYFASCILMPKEAVEEFWRPYVKKQEFVFGEDSKPLLYDMNFFERNTKFAEFVEKFEVSKKAAEIRLRKLNYL